METETTTAPEPQSQPQVKVWETDSTHGTFVKADERRSSLIENGRDEKTVKIRHRARGFTLKVHNGQTRAAPKKAKQAEPTLR